MAKDVWLTLQAINQKSAEFELKGFIDTSEQGKVKIGTNQIPIFSEADFLKTHQNEKSEICLAVGIGKPEVIKKVVEKFKGFTFPNLIHPSSSLHEESLQIGEGNIITADCRFSVNIGLGSFNIFNLNITIGHDSIIGSFNVFNPGCIVSGGVNIGSENLIGTGSVTLQYLKIGSQSVLGAGAVLVDNLASRSLAVGVPAKVIKTL
jgi:sugar O-acyltransferase (sialic acid O-acetyltransferase NeuD family)